MSPPARTIRNQTIAKCPGVERRPVRYLLLVGGVPTRCRRGLPGIAVGVVAPRRTDLARVSPAEWMARCAHPMRLELRTSSKRERGPMSGRGASEASALCQGPAGLGT